MEILVKLENECKGIRYDLIEGNYPLTYSMRLK